MKKLLLFLVVVGMALSFSVVNAQASFFIDFEEGYGHDGAPIINIPGVSFDITGGYNWIYGDSTTGSWNTRSIDLGYGGGSYQHYGNVFAFLGTDNNAGSGKVDFTNNDGTWFQTGYTSSSNFYLEGYDINGAMIASLSGVGNTNGQDMNWLRIDAPAGQYFDYVVVHDTGNYFLVDNMSGDASGINDLGGAGVPEPASMTLLGLGLLGFLRKRKLG